jgi:hypothetical protein
MKEITKLYIYIYIFILYFIGIFIAFEMTFWNIYNLDYIALNQGLLILLLIVLSYIAYLINKVNKKIQNLKIEKNKDHFFIFNLILVIINMVSFIFVFAIYGIVEGVSSYQLMLRSIFLTLFIIGFVINLVLFFSRLRSFKVESTASSATTA